MTSRSQKGRYEIFGSAKDDATRRGLASNWNLLKIRAVQGHSSKVINEDANPLKISVRQYALERGWTPSFRDLPKLGPLPCTTEVFASMPKLGYHASYWRNFEGIALNGIVPGGPTPSGSSGRTFAMMSLTLNWKRDSNHGIRPSAEIEFVVDLQAAALDGCRFFLTRTETLQTPDWISNRAIVYAYDRQTHDIIWFNRVYESIRRRIEDEKQTGMPHIVPSEVVDLIVSEAIHCPMEYYLGEVLPSHTEWLPQVWNMPMPAGVTQTSLDFYNLGVSVPEGHALHQSDNKDFPELGYRMQVKVCPLHGDRKMWQDFTSWRANACISIPMFRCSECGSYNLDGSVYCWRCGTRAEPHSDLSASLAPDRDRHIATLTGQPANLVSLQPRSDTNRNRAQQVRSGRAESSGPAVVKGQATKLLRKANNAGLVLEDTMSENAFTAYNHARFGITISSMEMVAKIAHMKIANPGMTRAMIERGSGYEVDAKLCYSPPKTRSRTMRRKSTSHSWTGSTPFLKRPLSLWLSIAQVQDHSQSSAS